MASKRRWVWVSRDSDGTLYNVSYRARPKPQLDECGDYCGDVEMCERAFEQFTDFRIEPGECVKVEFSAKRVK